MTKYQSWIMINQAYVVHNESKPTVRVPSLRMHERECVCVCVRVNGSVSVGTVVNFKTRSFVFVILPNVKRCYIKLFMFDCLGFQSCCTVVAFTCFQIILMMFA